MNRIFIIITLLFSQAFLFMQAQTPQVKVSWEGPTAPWNHLNLNNSPENFQFAIVTDRTGSHRPGVFPDAIQKLNLLQPEFVMSVGDLIEGYTTDTVELERQWKEFSGFISQLEMPFFYVPGNHDITNPVMERVWKEKFGTTHYYFTYQDVLFLCLNSEDQTRGSGRGTISEPQYEWIKKVLAENEEVKWTLLFMHQPLWKQEDPKMWPEVEKLLEDRKHTVFVGHEHRYVRYERNNGKYFILATTGGGSGLRGPRFGEFDHVMWVTMTDQGPILANLMLQGIWGEGVVTEEFAGTLRGLLSQQPLLLEPLLIDGNTFAGGKASLRLKNDSDVPMLVEIECESNAKIWAAFSEYSDTLPPNTTRLLEIPLQTQEPQALDELEPLELEAEMTYLLEGEPAFTMKADLYFQPERWYELASSKQSIQVDGDLSEWADFRFSTDQQVYVDADPFSHQGAKDASFSFDIREDPNFLYVGARIRDDEVAVKDGTTPFNQDGIAILLDARPKQIAANSRLRSYSECLILLASPTEAGEGDANLWKREAMPKELMMKARRTAYGYTVEAAIPHALLDQFHGGTPWESLRLNLGIRDFDQNNAHESNLLWQPDWRDDESRVGSGMFRRKK